MMRCFSSLNRQSRFSNPSPFSAGPEGRAVATRDDATRCRVMRSCFALCAVILPLAVFAVPAVQVARVPDGGIQPQVATDSDGVVHLIYYKGNEGHGDVFYVRSKDGAKTFSAPIRVNSVEGSAIAAGTIRGAHLALGKNNRPHVAWNGSDNAPKPRPKADPMCYARLNDASDAFEPQRNVITHYFGLDGGGSIAADKAGNVYIAWHAPDQKGEGEAARRVWVVRSADDGKTFAPETAASLEKTGACGCCGLRLFADARGSVYALYRSAFEMVNRDIYLLRSDDQGKTFASARIGPMKIGMCVMSSEAMAQGPEGALAAWETDSQIYWAKVPELGANVASPIPAPGKPRTRKHPALAANARGEVLLAWTEGTGWNKGGSLAWQLFDPSGNPIAGTAGKADGVAVWSFPCAFVGSDGEFRILY